jgi:hypothetical protein
VALAAAFSRQAAELTAGGPGAGLVARVEGGELDPWTAAELLLAAAAEPA